MTMLGFPNYVKAVTW